MTQDEFNLTKKELDEALGIDPFASDFGLSGGHRLLSNKIVQARKTHCCHGCGKDITTGTPHRRQVEVSGELGVQQYRWGHCCLRAWLRMAS